MRHVGQSVERNRAIQKGSLTAYSQCYFLSRLAPHRLGDFLEQAEWKTGPKTRPTMQSVFAGFNVPSLPCSASLYKSTAAESEGSFHNNRDSGFLPRGDSNQCVGGPSRCSTSVKITRNTSLSGVGIPHHCGRVKRILKARFVLQAEESNHDGLNRKYRKLSVARKQQIHSILSTRTQNNCIL